MRDNAMAKRTRVKDRAEFYAEVRAMLEQMQERQNHSFEHMQGWLVGQLVLCLRAAVGLPLIKGRRGIPRWQQKIFNQQALVLIAALDQFYAVDTGEVR